MNKFLNNFTNQYNECIESCKLANTLNVTYKVGEIDNLYRFSYIFIVSAMDYYLHSIVNYGIIAFVQDKNKYSTDKNKSLLIPVSLFKTDNEVDFETGLINFVYNKNKQYSFQNSKNIPDALSHVWAEKQKWKCIAQKMSLDEIFVKTKLDLIVDRRNSIVHEGDIDESQNLKYAIDFNQVIEILNFIRDLVYAIDELVFPTSS